MNPATIYDFSVPISPGELVDKITILEIKRERINDTSKGHKITLELETLKNVFETLPNLPALEELKNKLKSVNEKIWDAEEALRAEGVEDAHFLEYSKISHKENDERFRIKNEINALLGSAIQEVKSHQSND